MTEPGTPATSPTADRPDPTRAPDGGDGARPLRRCLCPGSYDPITRGHLDVIARAARLYDEVVVGVLENAGKNALFSATERVGLIEAELAELDLPGRVRVVTFGGRLLVDVCRDLGVEAVVKGLRGEADYAYELPMAIMNRHLSGVETLFMPGDPRYVQVSSSLIKEVTRFGGDVGALVGPHVLAALRARLGDGAGPAGPGAG